MAKQRKGTNIVDLIEPPPEGFNISREAWAATPEEMRNEIIRRDSEMSEGIAIAKDRRAGRVPLKRSQWQQRNPSKRVKGGHWELWKCERDGDVARAVELRELLKADEALFARQDALDPYHEMAAKAGKKLADVLQRYVDMENYIRKDPVAGIALVLRNAGVDPIDMATVKLAGVELAHPMFLKVAAQTIRAEPQRNWDGVHFGFMANEVEEVRPDCVAMNPNGYRYVNYERLSKTPEAQSLPVHSYRYKDFVQFLDPPQDAA